MKVYYIQYNIGHAKYVVSYHNGHKTHTDGSIFYDIEIFKNKVALNSFVSELNRQGYALKG